MTVGTWTPTNYTSMTGTSYPLQIDANFGAAARIVDNFAPRPQAVPNMTVRVDPGHLFNPVTTSLVEIAAQTTSTIAAPVLLPRIDRIVADSTTGNISIVAGVEAASPVAPAIPSGKFPLAQVSLQTSTTTISGSIITDERAIPQTSGSGTGGGFGPQASVTAAATTNLGAAGSNNIFVSGTGSITSFGSSASINSPIYILTFGGGATLVNSPHLLLPGGTNQLTSDNDSLLANYLGSGNWQILAYWSAVQSAVPVASVFSYAGSAAPSGFLLCEGQSVATASFPNLFAVLAYTYGGSGTNFTVPDLRGRVAVGFDPGNGSTRMTQSAVGGMSAANLGATGGQQAATLSLSQIPGHTHSVGNQSASTVSTGGAYGATVALPGAGSTGASGGGAPHNNVQPSIVLNFIIKI